MEPWFQVVLTIFSSVLASSGLWAYLQKKSEQKDVKTEMLAYCLQSPKHTHRSSKKYPQGLQFLDVFEYISTHFEWQKQICRWKTG